jgi:hypothetical protein
VSDDKVYRGAVITIALFLLIVLALTAFLIFMNTPAASADLGL